MADILSIGAGATQLYRQALSTVGNNIANLNTEGYSRQISETSENTPSQQGTVYVGSGARLDNIERAYDEFAEASLRDSGSKLSTQQPLIDYANRVVDIMGSEASGLSTAMDKFFAAASALSSDPASINLRSNFLREAEGMASRFRELSGQLSAVENETRENIETQIGRLNSLSDKLVFVNKQLNKNLTLDSQPPMLLDQRDQLLRDMSAVTKVHVTESASGQVQVRLGSSAGSLIADSKTAYDLGVAFDSSDPGRVDLIIEPYGDRRAASAVSSGTLGGLLNFRTQTLSPAMDSFDLLAQSLVAELNQIHSSGLDGRGERGADLFAIDPIFEISVQGGNRESDIQIQVVDPQTFDYSPFRITWVSEQNSWRIQDVSSGVTTQGAPGPANFDYAGLNITVDQMPRDGETYLINPVSRPASGFRLIQTDPLAVATADTMRVISDSGNIGQATVSLEQAPSRAGFNAGTAIYDLGNNPSAAAGETVSASYLSPAFVIPKGTGQTSLMMEVAYDSNLSFQVMTADGVHVLGHSIDESTQKTMLSGDSGFRSDSLYSDSYLNQTGSDAYLDLDMTYGFLARDVERKAWQVDANGISDEFETSTITASVTTEMVRLLNNDASVPIDMISDNALVLNGISLDNLSLAAGDTSSAAMMATWLNSASDSTGVTATASNLIQVEAESIDYTQRVTINGITIGDGSLLTSATQLADAINDSSASTNVVARVTYSGDLQLINADGFEGDNITLGNPDSSSSSNALGQANKIYSGQLALQGDEEIRFTFGSGGLPADLAVLGLRTGIYVESPVAEDIAVFVTGTGSASVAAGFSRPDNAEATVAESLEQPFTINFVSATQYNITDDATGTVVATRSYSAGDDIIHKGMLVAINGNPVAGDRFAVDGNNEGIGDNGNILRIVALRDKELLDGGRTFSEAYLSLVGTVGGKAALATMSKEAMQVVYDQAVASKDQISGVSLDQEAAELIRFQQAYQASAQIIQVASKLFDSILNVR